MLSELEKQTILAALRNGLGLTHGCRGIHKSPKDVSDFIQGNETFQNQCRQQLIAGYQTLIVAMNDAGYKNAWEKWRAQRGTLEMFITGLNLWESSCTASEWSFVNFTKTIRNCKTIPESATAMGLTEDEIWTNIYSNADLVKWLMQNNYPV